MNKKPSQDQFRRLIYLMVLGFAEMAGFTVRPRGEMAGPASMRCLDSMCVIFRDSTCSLNISKQYLYSIDSLIAFSLNYLLAFQKNIFLIRTLDKEGHSVRRNLVS